MSSGNDFRVKNVVSWKYGAEQVPALYVFETQPGDTIFTSLYAVNPETGARTELLGRDTLLHSIRLTEVEKNLLTRFY